MTRSKYKVELHYQAKQNDLSIFRTDLFFITPTYELKQDWEKDEQKLIIKYLSRFMRKPSSDGTIYIEEIIPNGFDCNGMERFRYDKIRMYDIKNGAVMIRHWWKQEERFFDGTAYSPEKAIEEFMQTIEIY